MKRVSCLLLFLLFCLAPFASALDEINFSFTKPAGTPYIVGAPEMNVDAEEFTTLIIKIKSDKSGTARLFWASSLDQQMNEPKSLAFFLNKSTTPKDYVFNVKAQNPYWLGFIPQILILPENGSRGIEIESAKAVPGNLFTNIRSGWREFFQYETIKARTVNIIKGPQINGHPVNFYVYILILLVFVSALTNELRQPNKLDFINKIQRAIYTTIIAAIVFAILLEARLWTDYFKTASLDLNSLWGKTLDEKREITTGGGFYDFLLFCNKVLPKGVDVSLIAPSPYPQAKGAYYLYPHRVVAQAGYLIVYHGKADAKNYSLLAKFNDLSYILRKNK